MASFSTWWPLKNRVSKTRFINQKNLKNFKFQAQPHLIRSDQIRERERVRSDEREGDQIRERERKSSRGPGRAAWVAWPTCATPKSRTTWGSLGSRSLGRAAWGSHDPGRQAQAAWVSLRGLIFFGFFLHLHLLLLFFLLALISILPVLLFCYI